MKLNKISMERYKEQLQRGFDILTNDPLDANEGGTLTAGEGQQDAESAEPAKTKVYEYYRSMQEQKR